MENCDPWQELYSFPFTKRKINNWFIYKILFSWFFFQVLLFQIFILVSYLRRVTQNSFFMTNWLTLKSKADHSTHHWCIFYQLHLKNIKSQWNSYKHVPVLWLLFIMNNDANIMFTVKGTLFIMLPENVKYRRIIIYFI